MKNRYVIADLHFGHARLLQSQEDRPALRQFASVNEMNEIIIDNWNKVVGEQDRVYVLGDVAMQRKYIPCTWTGSSRSTEVRNAQTKTGSRPHTRIDCLP